MNNCPDCAEKEDELAIREELLENTYNKGYQEAINEVREGIKESYHPFWIEEWLKDFDNKFKVTK